MNIDHDLVTRKKDDDDDEEEEEEDFKSRRVF